MIIVRCENCNFQELYLTWVRRGQLKHCPKCHKTFAKLPKRRGGKSVLENKK